MPDFRYLVDSAKKGIRGFASSGTSTAATSTSVDKLFPKVDSSIDGDDCNHDCASCDIKYPRGFSIDEDDKLYGNIKGWETHILVATGKTDWLRSVEDEKGSLMEALDRSSVQPSNGVR